MRYSNWLSYAEILMFLLYFTVVDKQQNDSGSISNFPDFYQQF